MIGKFGKSASKIRLSQKIPRILMPLRGVRGINVVMFSRILHEACLISVRTRIFQVN